MHSKSTNKNCAISFETALISFFLSLLHSIANESVLHQWWWCCTFIYFIFVLLRFQSSANSVESSFLSTVLLGFALDSLSEIDFMWTLLWAMRNSAQRERWDLANVFDGCTNHKFRIYQSIIDRCKSVKLADFVIAIEFLPKPLSPPSFFSLFDVYDGQIEICIACRL